MLGEVARDAFLSSSGCRAGDVVLLAGQIPIEGTSIIAREKRADLLARGWTAPEIDEAAAYLHEPGISILVPAQAAVKTGVITAMHDPTEGGIATGLYELAVAAGVGMEIHLDAIPVLPLAAKLCATYGLNPLGTIASGALLATCAPDHAESVIRAWAQVGWLGTVIGHLTSNTHQSTAHNQVAEQMTNPVTGRTQALIALAAGKRVPFPTFAADEIIKLWA
jgi:hydrogenase maturation factor